MGLHSLCVFWFSIHLYVHAFIVAYVHPGRGFPDRLDVNYAGSRTVDNFKFSLKTSESGNVLNIWYTLLLVPNALAGKVMRQSCLFVANLSFEPAELWPPFFACLTVMTISVWIESRSRSSGSSVRAAVGKNGDSWSKQFVWFTMLTCVHLSCTTTV